MHIHSAHDEWCPVTEGELEIGVGEVLHQLMPGDSLPAPRCIPHAFRNTARTGRILVVFQSAGTMEDFFIEASRLGPMTPTTFAELSSRHGMRMIGRPPS